MPTVVRAHPRRGTRGVRRHQRSNSEGEYRKAGFHYHVDAATPMDPDLAEIYASDSFEDAMRVARSRRRLGERVLVTFPDGNFMELA